MTMPNPKKIYLQPECCAGEEGRMWCEADIWESLADCDCAKKAKGIPYVREDVHLAALEKLKALEKIEREARALYEKMLNGMLWALKDD